MALTYSDTAKAQIGQYLDLVKEDPVRHALAIVELRTTLERIAANPVGGIRPTGPYENTPTFRFYLEAGDRRRLASAMCEVLPDSLHVVAFSAASV